jgi:hypothetical protein
MKRILGKIAKESQEELLDAPPEMIEFYFKRAAGLMMWAATGERIMNIPWPAEFKTPPELSVAGREIDPLTQSEIETATATQAALAQAEKDREAVESA